MRDAIRTARPVDQDRVEEVVRAAYQPWAELLGIRPLPMDADYAALIAQSQVHLTGPAEIDGLIVLVPEAEALLVENVAVRPERHGRGIGRRLLAFAEDEARRLELPAVRLYTNSRMDRNIALYTALGYTETGRTTLHVGQIVLMRKQVVDPPQPLDASHRPAAPRSPWSGDTSAGDISAGSPSPAADNDSAHRSHKQ